MQARLINLYVVSILFICCFGCSPMDATYLDFIKEGKTVYPGKADSIRIQPGHNRIQLSWLLYDPNVVRTIIYWNNRIDSIEIESLRKPGVDSMSVLLSDIDEGQYLFQLLTFDDKNNRSIQTEVPGRVYGELYINSLLSKPLLEVVYREDTTFLHWGADSGDEGFIGTSLEYTNQQDEKRTVFTEAGQEVTELPELKADTKFRYRTVFLPDTMAIDTFYTDYDTVLVNPLEPDLVVRKPVPSSHSIRVATIISYQTVDYNALRLRKRWAHYTAKYEKLV